MKVRESPDGANSSVADLGRKGSCSRASNATTVATTIDLDLHEDEEEEEKEDKKESVTQPEKTKTITKSDADGGVNIEIAGDKSGEEKRVVTSDSVVKVPAENGDRDIMMEFVMQDLKRQHQEQKQPPAWLGKRRPAVIRRPKKQRSRSLSTDKLNKVSETSSPKKMRRARHATTKNKGLFRSVERLPTLSPFDEERIVWMKNLEDDIAMEEERRRRNARGMVRQAAQEVAREDLVRMG